MAEKKAQHFVPQMLLRNFSTKYECINMYHMDFCKLIRNVPINRQCQKSYFYGKDLILEKFFEKIENNTNPIFRKIIKENAIDIRYVPTALINLDKKKLFQQYVDNTEVDIDGLEPLLRTFEMPDYLFFNPHILQIYGFVAYQKIRTKKVLEQINRIIGLKFQTEILPNLIENDIDTLYKKMKESHPPLTEEDAIKFICSIRPKTNIKSIVHMLHMKSLDTIIPLKIMLLRNLTNQKFILGDSPLLHILKNGYHVFLLPISPDLIICIYDEKAFFLKDKGKATKEISNCCDVVALNGMQYINANDNIYFNRDVNEEYINNIIETHEEIRNSEYYLKYLPEKKVYAIQTDTLFHIEDHEIKFNGKKICNNFLE